MEIKNYQPVDVYRDSADTLFAVSGMVLFSFAKNECDTKNIIIRNFVAKSAMTLKGVFALWDINDYQDAWIIHRALLDRMFHLHSLGVNKAFEEFDDWSFFEQYKAQNRVKSDEEFKHEAAGWVYELTTEQKSRINNLSKNKPTWRRPKAEAVAKEMNMEFLYKYGYDYASMHVHPMANDGEQDFYTITKLQQAPRFPSNITVLTNSILASSMILQDAINHSSFNWRKLIWEYLYQVRELLDTGNLAYQQSFVELGKIFQTEALCEPMQV